MNERIVVLEKQAAIAPLWERLPFLFCFPFRMGPALFLLCIVAASALAGMAFGAFGLIFRGFLIYLTLRYAFNLLDLFSQGRFESESPDNKLWGPEQRPAKFGLVLVLYLGIAMALGNVLVAERVSQDKTVQAQLLERHTAALAEEQAKMQREQEAFNRSIGLDATPVEAEPAPLADTTSEDDASQAPLPDTEPEPTAKPEFGLEALDRAEILAQEMPKAGDALWLSLLPAWYWLLLTGLSLLLPSAVIVIAMEDKFFKSLNPANLVFLIKSMGRAYFSLWALFLLIAGSRQLSLSIGADWPLTLRFPLEMALAGYLGMVLFSMLGYALYQYHQELGLEVAVDFDSHRRAGGVEGTARLNSSGNRPVVPQDPLEAKLQPLLAEGRVEEAIEEVRDFMRYDRFDPKLNTRLHQLYAQLGDKARTLEHGQKWLTALSRAGLASEAADALRKLRSIDPEFTVEDGDAILPLAQACFQRRDFPTALSLVRGFDKRFPKHKDTPGVLFVAAQLASEHLRKHDQAARILQMVIRHFPDAPVSAEARIYLNVLEKLMAAPAS